MKTMITAAAAFILSFQGAVAAQQSGTPEDESQGIPATSHQEEAAREVESDRFQRLDEDGDGSISSQEAQAETTLANSWSEFDQNSDGSLDAEEFAEFEQGTAPEEEVAQAGTQGETEEGMPASPHQEQAVEGELLGQLDTDSDGLISQQEAEADTRLADNWDQYDENADGTLDSRELDRFEQELSDTEEAE